MSYAYDLFFVFIFIFFMINRNCSYLQKESLAKNLIL